VHGRNLLESPRTYPCIPAYLYRGESGAFRQTQPSLARVSASLPPIAIADLATLSRKIVSTLAGKWGLRRDQAVGFLQHYGFPTDFIDATADPFVATSFASSLCVGDEGALCVIPTKHLLSRGELVDLRGSALAKRPRLQSAFTINCTEYPDLKSPEAIQALELEWLPFRLTQRDASLFEPEFELLDARSDEVAGLLWLLLDAVGKFSDAAASLLAQRIDPASFFMTMENDRRGVAMSEDLFEPDKLESNDESFRTSHYERWSAKFAEVRPKPLPEDLKEFVFSGPLAFGARIRILTPNALGLSVDDDILEPDETD
jgi:hypothetical protein